jgi:phage-related baseplate assembly protein
MIDIRSLLASGKIAINKEDIKLTINDVTATATEIIAYEIPAEIAKIKTDLSQSLPKTLSSRRERAFLRISLFKRFIRIPPELSKHSYIH